MGENSTQSVEYESEKADSIKAMQFSWLSHQKMKRTELPMEKIDHYLFSKINNKEYNIKELFIFRGDSDSHTEINLTFKYIFSENKYQELLSNMINEGSIVNYNKYSFKNNSNISTIEFKNLSSFDEFLSTTKQLPINKDRYYFIILERIR
jgi:hypothetical protein